MAASCTVFLLALGTLTALLGSYHSAKAAYEAGHRHPTVAKEFFVDGKLASYVARDLLLHAVGFSFSGVSYITAMCSHIQTAFHCMLPIESYSHERQCFTRKRNTLKDCMLPTNAVCFILSL